MPKTRIVMSAAALLASASVLPFAPAAFAQEAEASSASVQDVVTVTARRREESLTDVPVSVTAFSGDQLDDFGAQDITFVGQVTPNVTLEVSRGTNTTLSAFIRGVGQQDPVAGFESGVGIYLDDVYLNRPQAAVLDVYEVQAIEVLRGPQGTLYGRNTIGGAVKYVTKGLAYEPTATARVNVGSYSQLDVILSGSTPLADTFRVGGAIARLSRDGFGDNLVTGVDNYNKHVWAGRLSAEWDVTPNFQIRVAGDYSDDSSNARQGHRLIPDQFPSFDYPVLDDEFDTRAGLAFPEQSVEAYGGAITAEWTVNDQVTLKSITAYRQDESTTPIDFDSLPEADLDVPAIYENDQFSQEFQLQYTGDRLNGVVGAYYLDANALTAFDVILATTGALPTVGLPGLNAQTFGDVSTETWSLFADFSYDLTDTIEISLGARYTEDERNSIVRRTTFINGASDLFGGNAIPIVTTSDFDGSADFDDFSPK